MGCRICCCSCCMESFAADVQIPFNEHGTTATETDHRISRLFNKKSPTTPHSSSTNITSIPRFSFIPIMKIKQTRNGVVGLQITNYLQITNAPSVYSNWNDWHFELCYRFVHDHTTTTDICNTQWNTVLFAPDSVTQKGMFYIKIKLYLYDYQLQCKVRAKHKHATHYFAYSSLLTVNIVSSLIESTFDVGEYINFLDEKSMYTKEGFIDKLLPDSHIQIKCKHNDRQLVTVHNSRVYAAPIYLGFVIDLTDPMDVDKNMLLRHKMNDGEILCLYGALKDIYKEYALHMNVDSVRPHSSEPLRDCDATFIGRFVAKHVMDFLYVPYFKEPKTGCLVREEDGWISMYSYIHHCLNRHQKGIANNTVDVKMANLQELWSYCDICSVEISRYDWITSCNVEIYNSHVMCLFCVNNKIEQKEQLYHLLKQLLKHKLYDDCIEQLVEFVVGRVVAHQPII
eukprot:20308_1